MRLLQRIRAAVSRLMLIMAAFALAAAFMAPVIAIATATGQPIHAPPAATIIAIALFAGITVVVAFAITSTEIQANAKSAWYGRLFSFTGNDSTVEDIYARFGKGWAALRRRSRALSLAFAFGRSNPTTITFTGAA